MSAWNPDEDHFTYAGAPVQEAADPVAAIAWRGENGLAIEFYEILDADVDYVPFAREIRMVEVTEEYPQRMPVEALEALLRLWREHEREYLPVEEAAQLARERGEAAPFPTHQYSATDLRRPPFSEMRKRMLTEFLAQDAESQFQPPSAEDMDTLLNSEAWLQMQNWTRRQAAAHFKQLTVIAPYMRALSLNEAPIQYVAKELGISPVQARNLVQLARDSGYLTKGKQGAAGARPTRLAADLAEKIRHFTDLDRKAQVDAK